MTGLPVSSEYTTRFIAQMSYSLVGRLCLASGVVVMVVFIGSEYMNSTKSHADQKDSASVWRILQFAFAIFCISRIAFRGEENSALLNREFSTSPTALSLKMSLRMIGLMPFLAFAFGSKAS